MHSIDPDIQRQFAREIVARLRAAGHVAYWAGGCVRDQLLGRKPKDYDVATDATPEMVRTLFGRRQTIAIGAAFGVITVLGPHGAGQMEVATFRSDDAYVDGRRPTAVHFSTPEMDAQRRDFTINGLFFDPAAEKVLDYVGGEADLARGVIRAIGDPRARLGEDKLRMLRAVRFAATLSFAIEPHTLAAITALAGDIVQISAERIASELARMLTHGSRVTALDLLDASTLLPHVLAEMAPLAAASGDWQATRRVLGRLAEPTFPLALAALLHCASPGKLPDGFAWRLRMSNHDSERAGWLLAHVDMALHASETPWPRLQEVLIHEGAAELAALAAAIAEDNSPDVAALRERLAWPVERLNPPPLVNGNDLVRQGLVAGPAVGRLLRAIRDAQLLGQLATRDDALEFARSEQGK